jgi:hypothetical protein
MRWLAWWSTIQSINCFMSALSHVGLLWFYAVPANKQLLLIFYTAIKYFYAKMTLLLLNSIVSKICPYFNWSLHRSDFTDKLVVFHPIIFLCALSWGEFLLMQEKSSVIITSIWTPAQIQEVWISYYPSNLKDIWVEGPRHVCNKLCDFYFRVKTRISEDTVLYKEQRRIIQCIYLQQ